MTSREFERQRLRADDHVVLRLIEIGQSSAELVKSPSPCDHSLSGSNSVEYAAVASLTFDLSSIWGQTMTHERAIANWRQYSLTPPGARGTAEKKQDTEESKNLAIGLVWHDDEWPNKCTCLVH